MKFFLSAKILLKKNLYPFHSVDETPVEGQSLIDYKV